jgi:molybdopterin-guanine dinucleotide biosynthesis protein MobB
MNGKTKINAIAFIAESNSGKTTLLEKVIVELKKRGYRVGALKHDAHRFDIDHKGKDSYRLTQAGADTMVINSPEKLALVKQHNESPPLETLLETYFADVDIVLIEGYKRLNLPKIELHRKERNHALLCRGDYNDPSLIAIATDEPLNVDVPTLDINNPVDVADFIEVRYIL